MRAIALAAALLLALACQGPAAPAATPSPRVSCAELVARAETSPVVAVDGAFACIAADFQREIGVSVDGYAPITDDASFATFAAADPVYTAYEACPDGGDGWTYFDLAGDAGDHEAFRVRIDADGLVAAWEWGAAQSPFSTCP